MRHAFRRRPQILAALSLALCAAMAQAAPARYVLDPVHTRVLFAVDHAGFSHALGTVSGSEGELWFDPDDWSVARLRATVPMTRVDLGTPKWNDAAQASNLLATKRWPQATFASTRVEPVDATHANVYGTLTLHGVSHEVKLAVTLNAARRDPVPPFRRTVGFSATTTLSRKAFGIDAWPSMIGDAVELRLEVEATRAGGAMETAAPADTAPQVPAADPSDTTERPDTTDAAPTPAPTPATEPATEPAQPVEPTP